MVAGFASICSIASVASFIVASYVEWENAADALRTVAIATAPPALIGAILMIVGRWVYGGWSERAPIVNASSLAIRTVGFTVAIALGLTLVFFLATGMSADDETAAAMLGLGATAGVGLVFLGMRMKRRSGRRYLD